MSARTNYTKNAHRWSSCSLHSWLLVGLVLGAVMPRLGLAADSPTVAKARSYAAAHGFTPKEIEAGPASRRVRRIFVPVTSQTWNAFHKIFNAGGGYGTIRHTKDNIGHNALNLKASADGAPQDCYLWGLNYNADRKTAQGFTLNDCRPKYMSPRWAGFIAVANLQGDPIRYLSQALATSDAAGVRIEPPGSKNCMYWLPNAKVGPAEKDGLFQYLGLTRSADGFQMAAKLLHSANNRLEVIGVLVGDGKQFDRLSSTSLLGPIPKCGVDKACAF